MSLRRPCRPGRSPTGRAVTAKNGDQIDLKKLSAALGCVVVEMSALKSEGSKAAAEWAVAVGQNHRAGELPHVFTGSVEHVLAHIEESIQGKVDDRYLRWYAIKVFEQDEKALEELKLDSQLAAHLEDHIADCEKELDDDAESIITNQRYAYINSVVSRSVKKKAPKGSLSVSNKIDQIVTNRILALPIFALVMFCIYSIAMGGYPFSIGTMGTDFANDVIFGEWVPNFFDSVLTSLGVSGWLYGLIMDGIVAGMGAVLGFVPQMLVLFFLLAILEDVGDMAWKATVAAITGLIAKEEVVNTFGVLYQYAGEVDLLEDSHDIWTAIGAIGYMCDFAYVIAAIVFQLGGQITGEAAFSIWTVAAIALLAGLLYLLFRKGYKPEGEIHHLTSVAAQTVK